MVEKVDYLKVEANADSKIGFVRKLLFALIFFAIGVFATLVFQGCYKFKSVQVKFARVDKSHNVMPKLHFYDVLVHNKEATVKAMPYVLSAGIYGEDVDAVMKKLCGKVRQVAVIVNNKKYTELVLGPYKNLNDAYRAKVANHGFALLLKNNVTF